MKCPGGKFYGELGDGTTSSRDSPQDLPGFTQGVKAVASGTLRTCLLTISGSVKCWGYNLNSQLGDGTNVDRLLPTDVSGLPSGGVCAIASGRDSTCALLVTGGVKCWGSNDAGNLGDGGTVNQNVPVDVTGLPTGVVALAVNNSLACVLTNVGGVEYW